MQSKRRSIFNKSEKSIEQTDEEKYAGKKRERLYVPLTLYYLKDLAREFVNNKYFPDSILSAFAMLGAAIAFPFYPALLLILLVAAVFIISRLHPLAGLICLLFLTFPMFVYQAPLLGWLYLIFLAAALYFGYKHSATITVSYALILLPFSYLGYILEIPVFVMGVLFLGFKRGIVITTLAILIIPILSGLTGVTSTAPITYNQAAFRSGLGNPSYLTLLAPSTIAPSLSAFPSAFTAAFQKFFSFGIAGSIFQGIGAAVAALSYNIEITAIQLVVWLIVVVTISNYVVKSRSGYKGAESSLFCVVILAAYLFLNYVSGNSINILYIFGFIVAPPLIFVLELNDVNIVRSLEVMKKDFLGKFSEAFEDLTSGTHETLNDIANYTQTKRELTEAILEPIEHREIAGAYNIKPARGILLFGPPGTGKTLMMRAISNEIRARFFYVKTSSIASPYSGESVEMLSNIFTAAKKHTPTVLFFDEIDGIAGRRENIEGETSRQLLTVLLSEMDGFQKLEGVVIVGSTNVPQLLDPSIMRPGRFDKIIYMPLPDRDARVEVFKYYSKKYPMASDMDFGKLADMTGRFSNADISNACAEAARQVAEVALKKAKILRIDTDDIMRVLKSIKPSTSLSRLGEYEKFKVDYGRRLYDEQNSTQAHSLSVDDVSGLAEVKKTLYEALEIPLFHPALVKEYGVGGIKGILLFGPPGVGKTMIMNAVANELVEYKMLTISGSDLAKEGYEKAAAVINDTFNRAKENAPSIILIDEIDSLVPKRDESGSYDVKITSEFLRGFDSLREIENVIVVGTTNRPDRIDSAMMRPGRFDKLIFVGPPGKKDRIDIFQKNLSAAPSDAIDFDRLATMTAGYTGADIANICREAKMRALENKIESPDSGKITTDLIAAVIKGTKPSAPDSSMGRYQTFMYLH